VDPATCDRTPDGKAWCWACYPVAGPAPAIPAFVVAAMAKAEAQRAKYGLDVRCPTCGHGRGKFCHDIPGTPHRTPSDIALHPARVALAKSTRVVN